MERGRKYRILPPGAYGEKRQVAYFTTGSLWGGPQVMYFTIGSLWGEAVSTVFYHREPMGRGRKYRILLPGAYGERLQVPYFITRSLWGVAKTHHKIAILAMKTQKTL